MTFWSGEKIEENTDIVSSFDKSRIDVNSYFLRMGESYYISGSSKSPTRQKLQDGEAFCIPSGQFAYLLTEEELSLPTSAMAFISMRTGKKFAGLINVSGFHVDPGYNGKLIYAVYNAGPLPIHICKGECIFKIWFADVTEGTNRKFEGEPIKDISSEIIGGMSAELLSLNTIYKKTENLENRVRWLSWTIAILVPITIFFTSIGGFYLERSFSILEQQQNLNEKCSLIDIC